MNTAYAVQSILLYVYLAHRSCIYQQKLVPHENKQIHFKNKINTINVEKRKGLTRHILQDTHHILVENTVMCNYSNATIKLKKTLTER